MDVDRRWDCGRGFHWSGYFNVEAATVKRTLGIGVALLALVGLVWLAGCHVKPEPSPEVPEVPTLTASDKAAGWTLLVRADGPRWLGPDWWRAQGLDPTTLAPEHIRLTHSEEVIPTLWLSSADGPGLLFYGEATPGRLGPVGGYHLALDTDEVPAMSLADLFVIMSPAQFQAATPATVWLEEDNVYRPTAPPDTNWLWTSFNTAPALTLTVTLTEAVTAPVTLTLRLWGQSSMPQNPDHHIRVLWNGEPVDDHYWDGNQLEEWTVVAPAPRQGDNELVVISPGDTDAPVEVTWLDRVGVTWQRALKHTGGWESWIAGTEPVACWDAVPEGQVSVVFVGGDGSTRGGLVEHDAAGRVCVAQQRGERGWLGDLEDTPAPDVIRPRERIGEDVPAADYLVIAPRVFHAALAPLVEARAAEGLAVALVTPEQIYDAYGSGVPGAEAIRAAVTALHTSGQLRYLLLVGDASADPQALWQAKSTLVPTGWERTYFLGDTASEHALVLGDDGEPLVAIGRFPASTIIEVQAMVDKTLAWKPTARLLLLHDDEPEFVAMTDALVKVSAPDLRLGDEEGDTRRDLLRWLRDAPGVLIYSGHGSLPVLGDEKFLTVDDAGAWGGPTVVAAWTCLSANFTHPTHMGLSEAWLRHPEGAVAFVGPTAETTTGEQSAMTLAFQRALVDGATIGDALLAGWRAAQSKDAEISFVLLGDPALQPMPDR
ncbi:MAG: C25 family cysteine peptidase [Anaerolineae bacterium]